MARQAVPDFLGRLVVCLALKVKGGSQLVVPDLSFLRGLLNLPHPADVFFLGTLQRPFQFRPQAAGHVREAILRVLDAAIAFLARLAPFRKAFGIACAGLRDLLLNLDFRLAGLDAKLANVGDFRL